MAKPCEKERMLSHSTVTIWECLTGVGGKRVLYPGGTGFLAISSIVCFALVLSFCCGYCNLVSIAVVLCGIEWEVFTHSGEFPLVFFVVGHGVACYCLRSSLLNSQGECWFFRLSLAVTYRFGILAYVDWDLVRCLVLKRCQKIRLYGNF